MLKIKRQKQDGKIKETGYEKAKMGLW